MFKEKIIPFLLKKKKLILSILLPLVIILTLFFLVTADTLPRPPKSYSDTSALAMKVVKGVFLSETVELNNDDFNGILYQAKQLSNDSDSGFQIVELFGELHEDLLVIYCKGNYMGIPLNFTIEATLSFDGGLIMLSPKSVRLGYFKIPPKIAGNFLNRKLKTENIYMENGSLVCDSNTILGSVAQNSPIGGIANFLRLSGTLEINIREVKITENAVTISL